MTSSRVHGAGPPRVTHPGLQAVLFDMDGLLVDTEPQWFLAEQETVAVLGGIWTPADQEALLGTNLEYAAQYMLRLTGADVPASSVQDLLRESMTRQLMLDGVSLHDGAQQLLDALSAEGVRLGLVTSSVLAHARLVLEQVPPATFEVLVTAEDVTHKKPHPQPYQRALRALGVGAGSVAVLEDSPTGVAAAEAAGCCVVAVPSVAPIEPRPGRLVVESLTEVDPPMLRRLVTRW